MDEINIHDQKVILAKVAESAERFDEMREFMQQRAKTGKPLNAEERDLLSAAYKGSVNSRRSAARVATTVEQQEFSAGRTQNAALSGSYRSRLEAEMQDICKELMGLIEVLLPKAENGEPVIFYMKMKGDYNRYMAEVRDKGQREHAVEEAKKAYQEALAEADQHLLTTHPVRLGLSLNWAVFQNEILSNREGAVKTAETTIHGAMQALEGMPDEAYQDALGTLRMLQDNLALWSVS